MSLTILSALLCLVPAAVPADCDVQAREILDAAGVRGGLIVHVGCGDGALTAALRVSDRFIVHGLESDPGNVARARQYVHSLGLSGPVAINPCVGDRLPYAENMVNLLVVSDARGVGGGIQESGTPGARLGREMERVLCPGGKLVILQPDRGRPAIPPGTRNLTPVPSSHPEADMLVFCKAWPDGMDDWPHWNHGPDGNPVSQDRLVGPPRRLQWVDGPAWSKKHWGPRIAAMVSAGGRLFAVRDDTPTSLFNIEGRWNLTARDAFNGVVLWQRELPDWNAKGWGPVVRRGETPPEAEGLVLGVWGELGGGSGVQDATRKLVAAEDRVYFPLAEAAPLSAIDAATGEVLRTYEGISPVQEVVMADGVLLIASRGTVHAVEAASGRQRWERPGGSACTRDGRVYLVSPKGRSVDCVGLSDGNLIWELTFDTAGREAKGKPDEAQQAFSGPLQAGVSIVLAPVGSGRGRSTMGISAAEGRTLWIQPFGGEAFVQGSGPLLIDERIVKLDARQGVIRSLDPLTGRTVGETAAPAIRYVGHHPRCYESRATSRYIIGKERGADFVDLASGEVSWNNWVRGPCHRGVLPANGLLYAGQHSCRCYTESALHGFYALAPQGELPREDGDQEQGARVEPWNGDRLQQGPAYAWLQSSLPSPAPGLRSHPDWPTYRGDGMRSGATDAVVGGDLKVRWASDLSGRLSAPVVAEGRVYVSTVDQHAVHALDAATGGLVWSFDTGARVDSPPTVVGQQLVFGCRDGWVYCLRATDGCLAWRYHAAPAERWVGAFGQLESAWPVSGSLLVRDGVAYGVAGRSAHLDGGLDVLGLEVSSGHLRYRHHLEGPWPGTEVGASPETANRGFTSSGALADVLVSDDSQANIYLRHLRFDPTLVEVRDMQPNLYESPELTGENRGGDHKYWDNLLEVGRHALFSDPAVFHRSFFQNFPGRRLYATTGLLGEAWHRRMYWSYGQVVGQYIVFRGDMGYAVQVFATSPREGGANAGDGYVIYAGQTAAGERADEKLFALRPDQSQWRIRVPLRPTAMILAGETLWIAGPPDSADPAAATASVEGKQGGLVWAISTEDGSRQAEYQLDSPPVYDGFAAVPGKLILSTLDGRLMCLAE